MKLADEKVLFDANVLLDVLGARQPYAMYAQKVWALAEEGVVTGCVTAGTFSNIYYVLRKVSNHDTAMNGLGLMERIFEIIPLDKIIISKSIKQPIHDFEDAVQMHSAQTYGIKLMLSRDIQFAHKTTVPILTPQEFLSTSKFN